jgi:hypothetical protein
VELPVKMWLKLRMAMKEPYALAKSAEKSLHPTVLVITPGCGKDRSTGEFFLGNLLYSFRAFAVSSMR